MSISQKGMDDQMILSKFKRIFYKHQIIRPHSIILERGEDSPKSTPFAPLIPHISHDGSEFEQVELLKTLYKMDLTPSAQGTFSLFIHLLFLCFRGKTDLIVGGSLAGSLRSPSMVISSFLSHPTAVKARNI